MEKNNGKDIAMTLSVIILTWNSSKYIRKCIGSIYENIKEILFEVIVVDNGSSDGTQDILKEYSHTKPNFEVVYLTKNYGTTKPRNLAINKSKGEFILILDSDTELKEGAVEELTKTLKEDDRAGIVAPRLLYPDGSVQPSCKKFPTITIKILKYLPFRKLNALGEAMELYPSYIYSKDFKEVIPVNYCISAWWLVRKDALDKIGLFDERIFYAPEDVDLCLRMWLKDFKVLYDPRAEVVHHTQRLSKKNLRIALLHLNGLIYYFAKYRYLFSRKRIYKKIKKNLI
jgi:GT2 family glycosyltransferase